MSASAAARAPERELQRLETVELEDETISLLRTERTLFVGEFIPMSASQSMEIGSEDLNNGEKITRNGQDVVVSHIERTEARKRGRYILEIRYEGIDGRFERRDRRTRKGCSGLCSFIPTQHECV